MTYKELCGRRLRLAREALGITLEELAALTGNTYRPSRISNYEQGLRQLPTSVARDLAKKMGNVTPAYLLGLDDDTRLPFDAEEMALIRRFRRTDRRGRDGILQYAETQPEDHCFRKDHGRTQSEQTLR